MIVLAQPPHDRRAHALVNEEYAYLNGLGLNGDEVGILKGLGGKEKTGIDIVLHQAGILHKYLLHGGAMGKESQDVLYGKSCAPDDGLAYHYFGIYGYSFQKIFIIHEGTIGCSFDINVSNLFFLRTVAFLLAL